MALLIIIFIIIPLVHNSVSWLPYHTGKRQWVGNSLSLSHCLMMIMVVRDNADVHLEA